jgi:hypothetical protein
MIQMQGEATLSGGKRPTYSDIINAAVKLYAQQQGINT